MILDKSTAAYARIAQWLDKAAPLADLLIRLWVAEVFWRAGMVKIQSMYSTLYLFRYEYHVPLLPPEVAAYLATGIELGFPVLLALGLFTRFTAGFLFVYNIVAVISYPALWATGFVDHKIWGIMLLATLLHGPGALSVDALLRRWWCGSPNRPHSNKPHNAP
ncbi:DoxX family protein [Acidihalobacter prosperus]|uniref:DoxX family protein n=1 Tax=Acidihalobacter prosperus TaxID=160660 RepID=A0A1A6C8G1_9GAMM|nr:DoxX family protein [Acidihalobacter prosperus]OBS10834.1 hypothetical protein Thpro_020550 [Acidihalobacter prosperus]